MVSLSEVISKFVPRPIRYRALVAIGLEVRVKEEITCEKLKIGTEYGGYWVCPSNLDHQSIVYSAGVGSDTSFDLGIIAKFGCDVYAFDPTPSIIEWVPKQNFPRKFKFYPVGIASIDGPANFYLSSQKSSSMETAIEKGALPIKVEMRKLASLMKIHGHKKIDLLKLDIEGSEYKTIQDFTNENIQVNQLCLEFHHRQSPFSAKDTSKAIDTLRDYGLKFFKQEYSTFSFIKKR
jgi:FkbM family methyltransferase